MRRPLAILLIVALVAAGSAAVYFRIAASRAEARIRVLSRELAEARQSGKQSADRVAQLEAKAATLDSQLGSTKIRTTATETKAAQLTRELSAVRGALTERQEREVTLMAELESLRQQLKAGAPTSVATVTSPPTAPAAQSAIVFASDAPAPTSPATDAVDREAYTRRIAALESQLTEMLTRALADPIAKPEGDASPTADAKSAPDAYQVVRIGPREAFVVLDIGSEDGAQPGQQYLLARGTSEVARVQISDARPRFSIAQVLPNTRKRQLQTGDIALLAN